MQIPEKIDILGFLVTVIQENTHNDSHRGHAIHKSSKIVIYDIIEDGKLTDDCKDETFLHEILHFIDSALSLELPEKTISQLARSLFAVIRQNNLDFRRPENE